MCRADKTTATEKTTMIGNGDMERIEEDVFALTQVASAIEQAADRNDGGALLQALDDNLKLWVALRTVVLAETNRLPVDIRADVVKLARYTARKTIELEGGVTVDALKSLIHTNHQLAEGLLDLRGRLATD